MVVKSNWLHCHFVYTRSKWLCQGHLGYNRCSMHSLPGCRHRCIHRTY